MIHTLALEVEGRPDITIDLTAPGALETLKSKPFAIKEGAPFRMKVTFRVQHDVLSGLKYLQVVKRKGIRVGKDEEMLVSDPPDPVEQTRSHRLVCRVHIRRRPRRNLFTKRNVSSHDVNTTDDD